MRDTCFGVLSVCLFVQLPKGTKKITVASIGCAYEERQQKFQEFKELNPNLAQDIVARFVFEEYL